MDVKSRKNSINLTRNPIMLVKQPNTAIFSHSLELYSATSGAGGLPKIAHLNTRRIFEGKSPLLFENLINSW